MVSEASHLRLCTTIVGIRIPYRPKTFVLNISLFLNLASFYRSDRIFQIREMFSALRIFLEFHSKLEFSPFVDYFQDFQLVVKKLTTFKLISFFRCIFRNFGSLYIRIKVNNTQGPFRFTVKVSLAQSVSHEDGGEMRKK